MSNLPPHGYWWARNCWAPACPTPGHERGTRRTSPRYRYVTSGSVIKLAAWPIYVLALRSITILCVEATTSRSFGTLRKQRESSRPSRTARAMAMRRQMKRRDSTLPRISFFECSWLERMVEGEPRLGGAPSFAFSDLLTRIYRMSTMARGSASCCNLSMSLSWRVRLFLDVQTPKG